MVWPLTTAGEGYRRPSAPSTISVRSTRGARSVVLQPRPRNEYTRLIREMGSHAETLGIAKLKTVEDVAQLVAGARQAGRVAVFTNGCFDLLHVGHTRYLQQARALGDLLIVAINSDASVSSLKGPERPLIPQHERAEVLAALEAVDYVTIFDAPDPADVIAAVKPDILVKGGDWPVERIVGRETVQAYGGRVLALPLVPGVSTTSVIERLVERRLARARAH